MNKKQFVTIFQTYGNLDVVKQTLPSVVNDSKDNDAAIIVFDSTEIRDNRKDKWKYLQNANVNDDFFLILSSNLSVADSRNTCMFLAQQIYVPDYICIMDDDHGFKPGLISNMILAMQTYYGKVAPNGFRFGLFTGCGEHRNAPRCTLPDGHTYPDYDCKPGALGGTNGCFRCAPTAHWNNVLKGYDSDEYLISYYQTGGISRKNYHKGFTSLIVDNGNKMFCINAVGRGGSNTNQWLWDDKYAASDKRSRYRNK
jgi:glycosyltransferase involved in cell wall biosynthesis